MQTSPEWKLIIRFRGISKSSLLLCVKKLKHHLIERRLGAVSRSTFAQKRWGFDVFRVIAFEKHWSYAHF